MKNRRFYLPKKFISEYSNIVGSDALHIARVLRMTSGEYIEIFDGTGTEYLAKITNVSHKIVRVKIIDSSNNNQSSVSVTLAQALLKNKKMDLLLRQLTELGIKKWIPFCSDRSVPILSEKRLVSRVEKWHKISIESAKQCRCSSLPKISFADKFGDVLDLSEMYDVSILFWEKKSCGLEFVKHNYSNVKNILIVIGPEGGFSASEIIGAKMRGFILASLGPRVLKAETASIAACSIIQYLLGDIGKKA